MPQQPDASRSPAGGTGVSAAARESTREEIRAWMERWRLVNRAEFEELRNTPVEEKLDQLAALMDTADDLPTDEEREREVEAVRRLWIRLKQALRG